MQNAALAGGVVVGTSAEMMLTPFGALAAGFLAGAISTLGYKFVTVRKPVGPEQGRVSSHPSSSPAGLAEGAHETHDWCPVSSPSLSPNSKSKTHAVCTTSMGCRGSWEPSWAALWLGWPPVKLMEMGEFSPPSPHPQSSMESLSPWN